MIRLEVQKLGAKLKFMRKAAGMTQEKVFEAMPWWTVEKLSRIENGRQEPSYTEYKELEEFYLENRHAHITYIRFDGGNPARIIRA
ncbi:hypothetical protein SD70_27750 [Gordoniibacillus kamchatkensis]|uniref:HTH cro/C1-type domain-containing protein n=1 Tax=Gordoniibacillus kamchatkensis TaxID=1590651 RepID=A0ABR5AB24_9BACL|nr:helix-turn-helix transcriptional regulator [Paenibacillus sp. VKM B-2647]KIL38224.1 hypothetical protein SD70_27750 [Paenibacillus sp. VKM B-2647]